MGLKGFFKNPGMNGTEERFAQTLEEWRVTGVIRWWAFEALKIRLADKTTYSPDFVVVDADRELLCYEVKGFWRDDARAKIKIAAEHFPARFVAVSWDAKRKQWDYENFFKED
jgi:hypothetical protein